MLRLLGSLLAPFAVTITVAFTFLLRVARNGLGFINRPLFGLAVVFSTGVSAPRASFGKRFLGIGVGFAAFRDGSLRSRCGGFIVCIRLRIVWSSLPRGAGIRLVASIAFGRRLSLS